MELCELCGEFVRKLYLCDVCEQEMCYNCKWKVVADGKQIVVCANCKDEVVK